MLSTLNEHDLKMDDKEAQEIRDLRRKKLQWSLEEQSFRNRQAFREKDCSECDFSFSACADAVFRESIFGVYLKSMNEKENHDGFLNENKFGITQWDLVHYSNEELKEFTERNLQTDDMYDLLLKAVKTLEVIDWDYLYDSLISLRLSTCNMQWLDDGLNKFKHLVVLILTGNFLQKLPGDLLPRKLKFLEVYANEITELASLVQKSPKRLLHIGLGRNKLADVINCHLLSNSQSFYRLRTVDLSDNDFVDLQPLVAAFSTLKYLQSLNLEGNPCSVCVSYKDVVLENLPHLIYLDNVELLEKDRKIVDASVVKKAVLVFNCYRITGLSAPPKQKNVKQTIHVEVSFPLLEELDIAELNPEPVEEEEPKAPSPPPPSPTQSRASRTGSQQSKKSRLSIKSLTDRTVKNKRSNSSSQKEDIKIKEPGPYDAPDEYEKEVRLQLRNPSFKTERTTWSKTMQFSEDCVVVETNECDLIKVRDTFRSCVEVRVVYLVTTTPPKPKKAKGDKNKKKEGKGDKKGDKKGKQKGDKEKEPKKKNNKAKGGENGKQKEIPEGNEPQQQDEPEPPPLPKSPPPPEIIMKKITLVKFKCDLHNINWSDKTIDFYWAKHDEVGEKAIPVEGSLKAIVYAEGKRKAKEKTEPKKEKKGKQKAATENVEENDVKVIVTQKVPNKVPNYMTVQVGFGLRRSYFPKTEELQVQAK